MTKLRKEEIYKAIMQYYNLDKVEAESMYYSNPFFFSCYEVIFYLREKMIDLMTDYFFSQVVDLEYKENLIRWYK